MRIPQEIITLFLAEISKKPQTDTQKAEPVGESTKLSFSASDQPAVSYRQYPGTEDEKSVAGEDPFAKRHPNEERRKENRRKETRSVFLDTRSSRGRRESRRHPGIDFEI